MEGGKGYFDKDDCRVEDLEAVTQHPVDPGAVPLAADLRQGIPVYAVADLSDALADPAARRGGMAEWAWVFSEGPGVLVLAGAFADTGQIDAATRVFEHLIAQEKQASGGGGDHFAAAGANDRIWNALQKLCLQDPQVFARYHGNVALDAVAEAWLGPAYQMTAQVNLVRPGGTAQEAHRDYHLGFMTEAQAKRFPAHIHALSPALTLQGAVAHCDMPVESGPTKLLPHSQKWPPGFVAFRQPDVRAFFEAHYVQLPLRKGDAVFFNPALLHAAGDNRTSDIHRMANLLQISSAMGRAMEAIDRAAMARALFPALRAMGDTLSKEQSTAAIAAAAEGYAFPTNLDTDPPIGGLAPRSQAQLMQLALAEGWTQDQFETELKAQEDRRLP